jgi:hypothetical protein
MSASGLGTSWYVQGVLLILPHEETDEETDETTQHNRYRVSPARPTYPGIANRYVADRREGPL